MKIVKISLEGLISDTKIIKKVKDRGFDNCQLCYYYGETDGTYHKLYESIKERNKGGKIIWLEKKDFYNIDIFEKHISYKEKFQDDTGMIHLGDENMIEKRKKDFKNGSKVFCVPQHLFGDDNQVYTCYNNNLLEGQFEYFSDNELI